MAKYKNCGEITARLNAMFNRHNYEKAFFKMQHNEIKSRISYMDVKNELIDIGYTINRTSAKVLQTIA